MQVGNATTKNMETVLHANLLTSRYAAGLALLEFSDLVDEIYSNVRNAETSLLMLTPCSLLDAHSLLTGDERGAVAAGQLARPKLRLLLPLAPLRAAAHCQAGPAAADAQGLRLHPRGAIPPSFHSPLTGI